METIIQKFLNHEQTFLDDLFQNDNDITSKQNIINFFTILQFRHIDTLPKQLFDELLYNSKINNNHKFLFFYFVDLNNTNSNYFFRLIYGLDKITSRHIDMLCSTYCGSVLFKNIMLLDIIEIQCELYDYLRLIDHLFHNMYCLGYNNIFPTIGQQKSVFDYFKRKIYNDTLKRNLCSIEHGINGILYFLHNVNIDVINTNEIDDFIAYIGYNYRARGTNSPIIYEGDRYIYKNGHRTCYYKTVTETNDYKDNNKHIQSEDSSVRLIMLIQQALTRT